MSEVRKGSCLCGGIKYTVTGEIRDVTACHCTQCRKQTGHYFAASAGRNEQFEIVDEDGLLKWYRASDFAARGFCSNCGSVLFWKRENDDYMSFLVGSLDGPTNLKLSRHIFTEDKGDYYEIEDSAPQFKQY
ncbi:MAG: GFA family protein [Rhizobiaceae bacterium]|nr:GFA family protein [Rhizobiaceae bacterium]